VSCWCCYVAAEPHVLSLNLDLAHLDLSVASRTQELLDTLNDLEPLTGRNAVWLACDGGHEETAKLLISHGGDCHMSDAKGVSVFQIARLKCTPAFLAYIAEIVPEGEPCVCGVYDRGAPPSEPHCP